MFIDILGSLSPLSLSQKFNFHDCISITFFGFSFYSTYTHLIYPIFYFAFNFDLILHIFHLVNKNKFLPCFSDKSES